MSGDFDTFFEANHAVVERAVAAAIGNHERAEELTQEAFARAYRRWRAVSKMERPVAWLYVVALNTERKRWRREQHEPRQVGAEPVVDHAESVVLGLGLQEAIGRLPPRQRSAIALRYLADLSVGEVARCMGCAEGTVKATIHQALKKLRMDVGGGDDELD